MIRLYLKIPAEFVRLILQDRFWVVYIPSFILSNFSFLYNSYGITFPTQSFLVLNSFWANLLNSFIMWLIVLSLLPHNQHLLFCCILSVLALIWLGLRTLFYAAIRKNSVSLLKFSFLSHVQVFSYELTLVCRLKYPYSCFSSYFCFLVIFVPLMLVLSVLFLGTVISFPSRFSTLSLSRCIDASTLSSMLVSPLPLSFLVTYRLSTSFQVCIVVSCFFLGGEGLWSIYLSSFFIHFKNGPDYLTRGTAKGSSLL